MTMKLVSWNVNGLRAIIKKDFEQQFKDLDADIICIQETKMQEGQCDFMPEGYQAYFNYAIKKGYSGTALYSRIEPLDVSCGIGLDEHDGEGRIITAEYEDFFLVCVYVPNAQPGLKRIDYRVSWEDVFSQYVNSLRDSKPVIICGDLNVAHKEIDLANPKENEGNPGYSIQEREAFQRLLDTGFIDTFRYFYPGVTQKYSWWSYRTFARDRNIGWRIDYFLVSEELRSHIKDAAILDDYFGSDHCPVVLELEDF